MQHDALNIFARLSILEFAIEVAIANQLASLSEEDADTFRKNFVARCERPVLTAPLSTPEDEQLEAYICEQMNAIAANLMQKVERRTHDIRTRGKHGR